MLNNFKSLFLFLDRVFITYCVLCCIVSCGTLDENKLDEQTKPDYKISVSEYDIESSPDYIVNSITLPNGEIIAARNGGKVVKIDTNNKETVMLCINGASDWRGLFKDSHNNVFISPHSSAGGSIAMSERGIYKLAYGTSYFKKVHSLYDVSSNILAEREKNDDCIWTFCEDDQGGLYAGIYAHTLHENPCILKSIDEGENWQVLVNFNENYTYHGQHIHSVVYSNFNKSLYAIIGEINTIIMSKAYGKTWVNLNVHLTDKGSSMLPTKLGLLIGSDSAYNCEINLLLYDNKTIVNVEKIWANTVFSIRISDLSGYIYAFTKIDSSVRDTLYFPPSAAIQNPLVLNKWKMNAKDKYRIDWENYYNSIINKYPDDAIRPRNCAILISKDNGLSWNILSKMFVDSNEPSGFWTTGYFNKGKCLTGFFTSTDNWVKANHPYIISEELTYSTK